jgi:hypothetical protein
MELSLAQKAYNVNKLKIEKLRNNTEQITKISHYLQMNKVKCIKLNHSFDESLFHGI